MIYDDIALLCEKYGARRAVLFGSRARKDNQENSDIDVAIYEMPPQNHAEFAFEIEELDSLLGIDIVHIRHTTDEALLQNIQRDGVIIMDKFIDKRDKFCKAIDRLSEAIEICKHDNTSLIRDGLIQRFEFTTELAWKTTREKLLDEGFVDINTPKNVMKKAFFVGLITDEKKWLNLLNERNQTSHLYDEDVAEQICENIQTQYLQAFEDLLSKLSQS
ncbi:MAG: HI0074 family nucleotidyltransferase substrate-binding subunit [Clostridia bacterium]